MYNKKWFGCQGKTLQFYIPLWMVWYISSYQCRDHPNISAAHCREMRVARSRSAASNLEGVTGRYQFCEWLKLRAPKNVGWLTLKITSQRGSRVQLQLQVLYRWRSQQEEEWKKLGNGQHSQLVPELWLVPAKVGCDRNHFTIWVTAGHWSKWEISWCWDCYNFKSIR